MKLKYIHFQLLEKKTKTNVYLCLNNKSKDCLGPIKWYPSWRQYCFFPSVNTVFNKGCMEDINGFIDQVETERKTTNGKRS
jgi:hypothetical protein